MKISYLLAILGGGVAFAAPAEPFKEMALETGAGAADPELPKHDDPEFIRRIMDAHWYWRRIHCAQDLKWDPELAKAALASVSSCTNMPQHVSFAAKHQALT